MTAPTIPPQQPEPEHYRVCRFCDNCERVAHSTHGVCRARCSYVSPSFTCDLFTYRKEWS